MYLQGKTDNGYNIKRHKDEIMLKDIKELESNSLKTWKDHSKWKDNSLTTVPATSIITFFTEQSVADNFAEITNCRSFFNKVNTVSKHYAKWAVENSQKLGDKLTFSKDDIESLKNFFKGFMGEYFFMEIVLKRSHTSLVVENRRNNTKHHAEYYHVIPIEEDFGIDGLCVDRNGDNCVIQVKFWNDALNDTLKLAVMQKAYCEGVVHKYIDPYADNNVIICWLGNNTKVTPFLKKDKDLNNHIVFVDSTALGKTIDNNTMFWKETFIDGMKDIVSLAG